MSNAAEEFLTLQEIARAAHQRLPREVWDFLSGGCESETTMLRNRLGLDCLALRPRVLRDVSAIDVSREFLGVRQRIPVSLAPMGSQTLLDAAGTLTAARAAESFGVISYLSSVAEPGLEEVAAASGHPKIYQLYVRGDKAWVTDYVRRAEANGFVAFCLTVDTNIYSRRERDMINRFIPTARRSATGHDFQAGLSWELVKWFKDSFDMPLVLKGIATAEDAEIAVGHGVDVIYISNHGGRQLDHGRAAIDVLPEVAKVARGKAQVMIDGGFLRGTDVVKAIALGADAVAIGKLQGWGLAAAGQQGVERALELLEDEIIRALGLLGVTGWDQLDPSFVHAAPPVVPPGNTSPYPHVAI